MNDDACRTYNANSQIKFKTTKLWSICYNHSDGGILLKRTIAITEANDIEGRVTYKNCPQLPTA